MMHLRFVFHPVLSHKRSRLIYLWFLFVGSLMGLYMGWTVYGSILQLQAMGSYPDFVDRPFIRIFLAPYILLTVILISSTLAAALTAHIVVGPIKRIQEWVMDWNQGNPMEPLQIRRDDKYTKIAEWLNRLHQKINPSHK